MDVSQALEEGAHTRMNCYVRSQEVGGGGDCLYHSFAAVLAQMVTSNAAAWEHILSKLHRNADLQHFLNKPCVVQYLRQRSANAFEILQPEAIFDLILTAAVRQRLGAFEDGWDPEPLLVPFCG